MNGQFCQEMLERPITETQGFSLSGKTTNDLSSTTTFSTNDIQDLNFSNNDSRQCVHV